MTNRKYNARLLDIQMATQAKMNIATGGSDYWSKDDIASTLNTVMDAATFASLPPRFLALALRWRSSPDIGLPVSPFTLYKRDKALPLQEKIVKPTLGSATQNIVDGPYWQLSFTLKNTGAQGDIKLAALDENGDPYANTTQTFTLAANASTTVKIKFPNIYGIGIISGSAVIAGAIGVRTEDFLNGNGWVLTETVGLPFKDAGPIATVYQNLKQGYNTTPISGYQAAINRLKVAQLFYKEPTYLQPDGVMLPTWPTPGPAALIDAYHKEQVTNGVTTGILHDIEEMLSRTYFDAKLYNGRQSLFMKEMRVKGFSDNDAQSSAEGTLNNPVCSTTLMAAATDCWSALALGYGTTDFNMPISDGSPSHDYMVSATFQLPILKYELMNGTIVPKFDRFEFVEIASVAHMAPALGPVNSLGTEFHSENRPVKRDDRFSDDVKVYWKSASRNVPQSYAIAVKDPFINAPIYLNAPRPFMPGVKKPHLPTARADAEADDKPGPDAASMNRFFHHRSGRSNTGTVTKQYYVAGNDVFGRWSQFAKASNVLKIAPQVLPDIISGQFLLEMPSDPLSHKYNGTLELTIAWHWDDRSPAEINIGGHFVNLPTAASQIDSSPSSVLTPSGITLNGSGGVKIDLAIAFLATTPFVKRLSPMPGMATPAEAEISIDKAQSNMPHTGVYKIRIKGFTLDFLPMGKLAFTAYLRSSQQVTQNTIVEPSKTKMIYAIDPRPRTAPVLPKEILWASLPDAQNVSRHRISFQQVPGVAGYAIYRATEASLREKGGLAPISAADDINTRRDQLLTLAVKKKMKDVFIRLNSALLTTPTVDVELPGDLNGLYIYAVTTFTAQRAESEMSDSWLYVGVPRRHTPPAPVLSAFTRKPSRNPNVREVTLKIELPQGTRTGAVQVFKTEKSHLAVALDLMGPPAFDIEFSKPGPGWKAYDAAGVEIPVVNAASAIAVLKKTETVQAGWHPLLYRAASFGANDKVAGKWPGRSGSSNLTELLVAPPDTPPTLLNATLMSQGGGLLRLEAFSNASVRKTPYGSFLLCVEKLDLLTNVYQELLRREVPLIPQKKTGDTPALETLWRLGKDKNGNSEYEYYVAAEDIAKYRITFVDPLGRSANAIVSRNQMPAAFRSLVIKPLLLSVELNFGINISNKVPDFGNYQLDIIVQKPILNNPIPKSTTVYSGNLDAIGNVIVATDNPSIYVTGKDADGFYRYSATFKNFLYTSLFNGSSVVLRLTDPDGKIITLSSLSRGSN